MMELRIGDRTQVTVVDDPASHGKPDLLTVSVVQASGSVSWMAWTSPTRFEAGSGRRARRRMIGTKAHVLQCASCEHRC